MLLLLDDAQHNNYLNVYIYSNMHAYAHCSKYIGNYNDIALISRFLYYAHVWGILNDLTSVHMYTRTANDEQY